MIVYDVATKVPETKSFPHHNIAGLISGITFIVLFSQEKPLGWKKINTDTHTHIHIHTHTGTHIAFSNSTLVTSYTVFRNEIFTFMGNF